MSGAMEVAQSGSFNLGFVSMPIVFQNMAFGQFFGAMWFALLARWVTRVRPDHAALRYIPRIALVLLAAIALTGVIRAWT